MTFDAQQYIPLAGAYLCQDCDSVGNSAMQCPACASQVVMSLAGVLDRGAAPRREPVPAYPYTAAA